MSLARGRVSRLALGLGATVSIGAALSAWPATVRAQNALEEERERQFVEVLRKEDPADADRWTALRETRRRALSEMREAENQYGAAGPVLRSLALPRLTQAQRKYAEASLAVLDFLDTRDRRILANYHNAVKQLNEVLDERKRARTEFQKMLEAPKP
jgi:hypothetical protein